MSAPTTAVFNPIDSSTLPEISINGTSVTEGDTGTVNAEFAVSLSAATINKQAFQTRFGDALQPSQAALLIQKLEQAA